MLRNTTRPKLCTYINTITLWHLTQKVLLDLRKLLNINKILNLSGLHNILNLCAPSGKTTSNTNFENYKRN